MYLVTGKVISVRYFVPALAATSGIISVPTLDERKGEGGGEGDGGGGGGRRGRN